MNKPIYKSIAPIMDNRLLDDYKTASKIRPVPIEINLNNQGIYFNNCFVNNKMKYDEKYVNNQSNSKYFQEQLIAIVDIIKNIYKSDSILEIGCGQGYLFNLLTSYGYNVSGYDPAYTGKNKNIKKEYFGFKTIIQN